MFLSIPHQALRSNRMACSSPAGWRHHYNHSDHVRGGNGCDRRHLYRKNKCLRMSKPSSFVTRGPFSEDSTQQEYHFSDYNDGISLSIDLPGIKNKDLNVKFENDTLVISATRHYHHGSHEPRADRSIVRRFAIDGNIIDSTTFKANLADGVLIITASKKSKEEDRNIPITTEAHEVPTNRSDHDETTFEISVDVPGVKSTDLQVDVIEDGKLLRVAGQRRGHVPFVRLFSIDTNQETIDVSNLRGNLSDGVLVMKAPKLNKNANKNEENKVTITVTTHEHDFGDKKNMEEDTHNVTVDLSNDTQAEEDEKEEEEIEANKSIADEKDYNDTPDAMEVEQGSNSNNNEEDIVVESKEIEVETVTENEEVDAEETWEEVESIKK